MADTTWDVIIVGQGLAGTTLAWQLQEAGQRVLLIDAQEPVTSSKIAAGLMTPITGQRLALSWRASELLPIAQKFYERIERLTGQNFFHARRAVRLFKTDEERLAWSERSLQPAFQAYLVNPPADPLLEPDIVDTSGGGFEMHAAQLDVAAYLEASRSSLEHEPMTLDWHRDVTFGSDDISVQGRKAKRLISCEGFAAARNPYFTWVPFNAAKGDILTVRFHRPVPPKCLHRGIWLAPTSDPDVFRAGSSYDLTNLDQEPSASARSEIESKLQEFLRVPYAVIHHQAAVRPIIQESKALIGMHPKYDRLGFFNGLGSKGALHAPWFAQCFTDFLARGLPIPAAHDVQKHF
jgi:glycine oxidase